jgi:hypothetical protein
LKLFGVSTAAVATVEGIERVSDPSVKPLESALSGSAPFSLFDVSADVLYSSVTINKNEMRGSYVLFSLPLGIEDATLADTNMYRANTIPMPNMFCIHRIGFVFSPKTEPGLRSAFCDRYVLQFMIGQKRYWCQPLAFCFSKGEPDREKGFTTAPDIGMVELDIPLILDVGMDFSAQLIGTPIQPCGKLKGWALLGGRHARAVQ